ncbi:MAG: hypothetical protein ACPG4H_04615, partial [Marinobacterium sp.]
MQVAVFLTQLLQHNGSLSSRLPGMLS